MNVNRILRCDALILSFSEPGNLVLDIYAGSGTTCKMALLTGRRYLGFEPWAFAHAIAERRMADAHRKLIEVREHI